MTAKPSSKSQTDTTTDGQTDRHTPLYHDTAILRVHQDENLHENYKKLV